MSDVRSGQYFHLTHVNYDDENMTLFTRINMCDTLCDMLSIGPSMAPPACCCCCWWCQVLLLQHKRETVLTNERGILSILVNERPEWGQWEASLGKWEDDECNLSSLPPLSRPLTSPAAPRQEQIARGVSILHNHKKYTGSLIHIQMLFEGDRSTKHTHDY